MITIDTVHSIQATADAGSYIVTLDYTDSYDGPYLNETTSVNQTDPAELNQAILAWMQANPEFPIEPYVPPPEPTIEEIRAAMPPLTRRQLRLGLINNSIMPVQAQSIIDAMPAGVEKEKFDVEWNDGDKFRRLDSTVTTMLAALMFDPEEIDTLWNASTSL